MSEMKLLIVDKEGTLTESLSNERFHFVKYPEDQKLIDGVADAIALYVSEGWTIAIASSQGGVVNLFKTLEDAIAEVRFAMRLTGIECAVISRHCYEDEGYGECIFLTDSQTETVTSAQLFFRKPSTGMIELLATECYGNTLWRGEVEVLFVGDRPLDKETADNAKVKFMWAEDWRNAKHIG